MKFGRICGESRNQKRPSRKSVVMSQQQTYWQFYKLASLLTTEQSSGHQPMFITKWTRSQVYMSPMLFSTNCDVNKSVAGFYFQAAKCNTMEGVLCKTLTIILSLFCDVCFTR